MNPSQLQFHLDKTIDNKRIFGAVVNISTPETEWAGSSGNLNIDRQFFIASTTKLYVTAIILNLAASGRLDLNDRAARRLPEGTMKGLHTFKGKDYTETITIRHLLSQTSGISDYFEQKGKTGKSLLKEIFTEGDRAWSFEDILEISRKMKPHFPPGKKGKAFYSDTNFQLLGRIIQETTGMHFAEALRETILTPMELEKTYLYQVDTDERPALIYSNNHPLKIPKAMTSTGADGGIVSTAGELMIFLKAFFEGRFFPVEYFTQMKNWNRIFHPLEYGMGISRFRLPGIFSLIGDTSELIGHSGLSGAFAFFCPQKKTYLTGTVNQTTRPGTSFKLMLSLLGELK